jgi:hypothetical protein
MQMEEQTPEKGIALVFLLDPQRRQMVQPCHCPKIILLTPLP